MSDYSNPQLPEDINVSRDHPLIDFARLLGGIAVVGAIVLMLAADRLARFIPFSAELQVAQRFESSFPPPSPVSDYLQKLADRLAAAQSWPQHMPVRVHYVDEDTVNAFATLGGHVVIYRGLLEKLPSENALAMVLGHELAHVKLRHPIASAGRGLVAGVALAAISVATGGDLAARVLGSAGLLSALSFSREQERAADAHGLAALAAVYGHIEGAQTLFQVLEQALKQLPAQPPAFLRTHPMDVDRIQAIRALAAEHGWPLSGTPTALPESLCAQLKDRSPSAK